MKIYSSWNNKYKILYEQMHNLQNISVISVNYLSYLSVTISHNKSLIYNLGV